MTQEIDHKCTIESSLPALLHFSVTLTNLSLSTQLLKPIKDCLSRQTLYSSSYPRTMKANCTDILKEGKCIYHADDRNCNLKHVNSTIKYLITN